MKIRLILKAVFYFGIFSSLVMLWLATRTGAKLGFVITDKDFLVKQNESISFATNLYLVLIAFCTFGLLLTELFRKKND